MRTQRIRARPPAPAGTSTGLSRSPAVWASDFRENIFIAIFLLRLKSHLCVGNSTPQTVVLTTPSPVGTVIVQCTYRLTDTRAFLGKTGEPTVIYNLLSNFLMNLPTLLLGDQSIVEVTPGLTG